MALSGISWFVYLESIPISPFPFVCAGSSVPARARSEGCLLRPDATAIFSLRHSHCIFVFSIVLLVRQLFPYLGSCLFPTTPALSGLPPQLCSQVVVDQVGVGEELVWEETAPRTASLSWSIMKALDGMPYVEALPPRWDGVLMSWFLSTV